MQWHFSLSYKYIKYSLVIENFKKVRKIIAKYLDRLISAMTCDYVVV